MEASLSAFVPVGGLVARRGLHVGVSRRGLRFSTLKTVRMSLGVGHEESGHDLEAADGKTYLGGVESDAEEAIASVNDGSGGIHGGSGDAFESNGDSGDSGNDGELPVEALLVLKEAGRTANSLPVEVLDALMAGRANSEHLRNLLKIDATPLLGPLAGAWTGLRDRLVLNMRFWMVVAVELAIGFGSKTFVEVRSRGERFWKEFDFYLSDIALELVGDFALVWLLSPAMRFGPSPAAGTFADQILTLYFSLYPSLALFESMPKHALQAGAFNLAQRLSCILYKGLQFGSVGFVSSMIGHSATKALVAYREKMNPEEKSDVVLAPVFKNSLGWGFFMMISSSPRYQLVNAFEQRIVDKYISNLSAATATTFTVRLANCLFGGEHWMVMAKQLGLQ